EGPGGGVAAGAGERGLHGSDPAPHPTLPRDRKRGRRFRNLRADCSWGRWQRGGFARDGRGRRYGDRYPQCLHMLELLQYEHFRKELVNAQCAKFIDEQQILHWQHYSRKRMRLQQALAEQQQQNNAAGK
uniref:Mediator of RNA polymerase II transcription subunit 31 n=1 Tax=Felis catus TaxID=9685 RepID=A0ABI8AE90_FELCA